MTLNPTFPAKISGFPYAQLYAMPAGVEGGSEFLNMREPFLTTRGRGFSEALAVTCWSCSRFPEWVSQIADPTKVFARSFGFHREPSIMLQGERIAI